MYYATHSLFLSKRALYVVLWNPLEPESVDFLSYWLDSIQTQAPGARVVLVATQIDKLDAKGKELLQAKSQQVTELVVKKLEEITARLKVRVVKTLKEIKKSISSRDGAAKSDDPQKSSKITAKQHLSVDDPLIQRHANKLTVISK